MVRDVTASVDATGVSSELPAAKTELCHWASGFFMKLCWWITYMTIRDKSLLENFCIHAPDEVRRLLTTVREMCLCTYTHTEGIKCDRPSLLLISNSMALVTTTIHGILLHSCTTTTSYFTPCTITSVFYLKWRVTDINLYVLPFIPFQIENWPVVITPSMDWPYVNLTLAWDNKK